MVQDVFLGARSDDVTQREMLSLKYANRHGLVAGATGTGKTVTLQGMVEGFSRAGVPVFLADVKGDLSGMAVPSDRPGFVVDRLKAIGFDGEFKPEAFPVVYWDMFGKKGVPLRTTISEMGPLMLAQILELNDVQEGVLNIAFRVADREGLLLVDLKDLRSLLVFVGEQAKELSLEYGNVSTTSIGAIQRKLLQIEEQGGNFFFGEPAIDIYDFIQMGPDGKGQVNILAADEIMQTPRLYAMFLLWLLSSLFEDLPEVGDADKPRFVFFFDEAHLLFSYAPKSLLQKIEQVVKLIRSKGVGIYFVTQNPADIPDSVLSQLGNRVQHALRSFTDKQRKSIKLAAQTYRTNPNFDVETVITELGVGEALVTVLEKGGNPSVVQRTLIAPPASKVGPIDEAGRQVLITQNRFYKRYSETVDRHSAYEALKGRAEKAVARHAEQGQARKETVAPKSTTAPAPKKKSSSRQSVGEAMVKSVVRQMGSQLGHEIMRGILGAMKR